MTTVICLAGLAFLICAAITPAAAKLGHLLGFVDRPDQTRKVHGRVVPLGGGVAVAAATLLALTIGAFIPTLLADGLTANPDRVIRLALASAVIVGLGLVDDLKGLRGRQKLAGQIVAVLILVTGDLGVERLRLFGWEFELGLLALPFSIIWLLGAINALNLIDGADGFASTVGAVISMTIAGLALYGGHAFEGAVAAALAGALLGFLVHNFPPARVFLGDTGSMLIGLIAGACAMGASLKGPATVALATPVAILAIPLLDSMLAILRRKLTGRSIYAPDRGHLHHCLQRQGISGPALVACVGILSSVTAAGALASVFLANEAYAIVSVAGVTFVLIATGIFGQAEALLLVNRVASFGASLAARPGAQQGTARRTCVQLQGTRKWDRAWELLIDSAEPLELQSIRLNINMPWLHEAYHASWDRGTKHQSVDLWRLELPLVVERAVVGRLHVSGPGFTGDRGLHLSRLAVVIESLEDELRTVVAPQQQAVEEEAEIAPTSSAAARPVVGASA